VLLTALCISLSLGTLLVVTGLLVFSVFVRQLCAAPGGFRDLPVRNEITGNINWRRTPPLKYR
jgi:hypothetical protein